MWIDHGKKICTKNNEAFELIKFTSVLEMNTGSSRWLAYLISSLVIG